MIPKFFQSMSCAGVLLLAAAVCDAQNVAAFTYVGSTNPTASINPSMWGFTFNVTSQVTVYGLSYGDAGADGLIENHQIGLWDASGTLKATAIVDAGTVDPLDSSGKFRYKLLASPLTLSVGNGYTVAGMTGSSFTNKEVFENNLTEITDANGIVPTARVVAVGQGFVRPTTNFGNEPSAAGSFVIGPAPTPEFGSVFSLGGLLLAGSAALLWKQRRAKLPSAE